MPTHTINGQRFRFSKHATDRALDMAVEPEELLSALRKPRKVVDSKAHPGTSYWTRGRVTLGVAYDLRLPDVITVVTVLWSSAANWDIDYELAPAVAGREARTNFREARSNA
ncbi:hypothetical protein [Oerskovia enterophila]